jgi:hypothetical protein
MGHFLVESTWDLDIGAMLSQILETIEHALKTFLTLS